MKAYRKGFGTPQAVTTVFGTMGDARRLRKAWFGHMDDFAKFYDAVAPWLMARFQLLIYLGGRGAGTISSAHWCKIDANSMRDSAARSHHHTNYVTSSCILYILR